MGAASGSVRGSGGDAARQRTVVTIRKRDADLARLREDHALKVVEEAEAEKRAASENAECTWMRTELRRTTARLHKQDVKVQRSRDAITRRTADAVRFVGNGECERLRERLQRHSTGPWSRMRLCSGSFAAASRACRRR